MGVSNTNKMATSSISMHEKHQIENTIIKKFNIKRLQINRGKYIMSLTVYLNKHWIESSCFKIAKKLQEVEPAYSDIENYNQKRALADS